MHYFDNLILYVILFSILSLYNLIPPNNEPYYLCKTSSFFKFFCECKNTDKNIGVNTIAEVNKEWDA